MFNNLYLKKIFNIHIILTIFISLIAIISIKWSFFSFLEFKFVLDSIKNFSTFLYYLLITFMILNLFI